MSSLVKTSEALDALPSSLSSPTATSTSNTDKTSAIPIEPTVAPSLNNETATAAANELDENDNYYDDDNNDDYYDDDCNYDDDHNNNYICESGDDLDDFGDENDLYANDPEQFAYESVPIEQIDTVVEKKCQRISAHLKLDDPLDSVYILKKFNWNCQKIIDAYDKDTQAFLNTYFSDANNNDHSKTMCKDKLRLTSYLNIFTENKLG